jgi:hypothetical protein
MARGGGHLCHYAVVTPYAAYLRIYEPLSAFQEPQRSRWAAYAASSSRPRRMNALAEEYTEALRRVAAVPPVVLPERESEHAYIRWAEGVTYICPWQTRLRSWLALSRLRATAPQALADAFAPGHAELAAIAFVRSDGELASSRIHILTSLWAVPLTWFVPFSVTERWLKLGSAGPRGDDPPSAPREEGSAPPVARALVYATAMSQARRRVGRGLAAVRGAIRALPAGRDQLRRESLRTEAELDEVGRWLAEFHPYSLVELDYGGLVHLLSDEALRGDESVAEIAAAIDGLARGEWEVAMAMHRRALARWQSLRATEFAN